MTEGRGRGGGAQATTVAAAALLVFVWGTSSVATRIGMDGYGPGQLALFRFLITSAVMAVYAAATRMRLPARRDWLPLIGIGVVGISITQLAFTFGLETVDPGTATFIFSTVPVMTALLARLVLGERLSTLGWIGIALTVAGTTVLVLGQGQGIAYTRGALILLLGAFAEAWYYILQKPFLRRYTPVEVGTWTLIGSTLPLMIFLPGLAGQVASAPPASTAAVVYVALGAGAVGYVCFTVVNSRVPAAFAAVLLALLPPVALVTAWIVLGVAPPLLSVAGGLVSLAGVLLVTLRGRARGPRSRTGEPSAVAAD